MSKVQVLPLVLIFSLLETEQQVGIHQVICKGLWRKRFGKDRHKDKIKQGMVKVTKSKTKHQGNRLPIPHLATTAINLSSLPCGY